MSLSILKVLPRVLLSTLILLDNGAWLASAASCSFTTTDDYCAIQKVSIQTTDEATSFAFPDKTFLMFLAPNIPIYAQKMFDRVPNAVDKLELIDGYVPEASIRRTLYHFKAQRTQLQNLIVDESGEYLLKTLVVINNPIRSMPDNVSKLTKLIKLYWYATELETLNMDHFKDMSNLELMSLYENRIHRIDTKVQVNLPKLSMISLNRNYLENLSVKLWSCPNLETIYLHSNKLRAIQGFSDQFPKLSKLSLGQNRWSCTWLSTAKIWTNKVYLYTGVETCFEKIYSGICCEDTLDDVRNSLTKSMTDQCQQMITKLKSEMKSDMDRTVQNIKQEVKTMESTARSQMATELQQINTRVNTNQFNVGDNLKQLERKLNAFNSDLYGSIQDIKEDVTAQETKTRDQMKRDLQEINAKMVESRLLIETYQEQLEEKINSLKSDTATHNDEQLSNAFSQQSDGFFPMDIRKMEAGVMGNNINVTVTNRLFP